MKKIILISIITVLCLALVGCNLGDMLPWGNTDAKSTSTPGNTHSPQDTTDKEEPTPEPTPQEKKASIMSFGDIMVHSTQLTAQYNRETDTYDFSNNFQFIEKHLSASDYAVGNVETTFAGEQVKYAGYPFFNTPDTLADALKKAGLDLALTANNHIYDTKEQGFKRTLEVLKQKGFDIMGSRLEENEDKFFIKDINGIKVGFINYTYETVRQNGKKSLNGNILPDHIAPLIDSFDYDNKQAFYDEVEESMATMTQQGAEFFIAYIHWGNEYKITQNSHQEAIAQNLCELGIDVILGGHPHVVQPADVLISEDTGNKTFVVYSMGNFISNQRIQFMNNIKTGHTEDGVMINLNINKDSNGEVQLKSIEYMPTWVNMYQEEGRRFYEILPLPEVLSNVDNPEAFNLDKIRSGVSDAQNSYDRTVEIMNRNAEKISEHYSFGVSS